MSPVGFEPTISAGERPQTYALDRAGTGTGVYKANWSRNSPHFTEPEGSLLHSQASATCLIPGPAQYSPYTHFPPPGDPS